MTQRAKDYEYQAAATRTSSSTTTYTTDPGVFDPTDLEAIRVAYEDNLGCHITSAVAAMIERHLRAGMEAGVVIYAIEETGMAARPTPHYLRAILTRLARANLLAMTAVDADIARREHWIAERRQEREERWFD